MTLVVRKSGLEIKSYDPKMLDTIFITEGGKTIELTHSEFCAGLESVLFSSENSPSGEDLRQKFIKDLSSAQEIQGYNLDGRRLRIPDSWRNSITTSEINLGIEAVPAVDLLEMATYVFENTDLLSSADPRVGIIERARMIVRRLPDSSHS